MVYTVTFNPALDYVVRMDGFKAGDINRTQSKEVQFGGKGINVSTLLCRLGVQNAALGFPAGFTGQALERGLRDSGVQTDFIWRPEGLTRINVKIKAGEETEINGQGPAIPAAALEELFREPGEIFGKILTTDEEIIECAGQLQAKGAHRVLVSMAGNGSLLLDETDACHRLGAPKGKVRNSVGAGVTGAPQAAIRRNLKKPARRGKLNEVRRVMRNRDAAVL